jgi:hypothetical protein
MPARVAYFGRRVFDDGWTKERKEQRLRNVVRSVARAFDWTYRTTRGRLHGTRMSDRPDWPPTPLIDHSLKRGLHPVTSPFNRRIIIFDAYDKTTFYTHYSYKTEFYIIIFYIMDPKSGRGSRVLKSHFRYIYVERERFTIACIVKLSCKRILIESIFKKNFVKSNFIINSFVKY